MVRIRCCLRYNVDTYMHKSRIISDCKRSGVSAAATRTHKSALPRVTDAAQSALELMDIKAPDQDIVLFIADIVDAFWLIPFHMSERRYFCAQLRRKWCTHTHTHTHQNCAGLRLQNGASDLCSSHGLSVAVGSEFGDRFSSTNVR